MTKSDIALRDACILAEEMLYKDMFADFESQPFIDIPEGQREKVHKLIYGEETTRNVNTRKKTSSKKIKTVLLIAAILIILFGVTATAFNPLRDFIIRIYRECTEIVFEVTNKDDYPFAEYTYIPKGYEKVNDIKFQLAKSQSILYRKDESIIKIYSTKTKHSSTFIDTENAETGEILVNEITGYYSITETSVILVWSTGKYSHYMIADKDSDLISIETLIKIAQSRRPSK